MLKDMDFYHLRENIKKIPDSLKTASKKVVHKAGEFLENKILDAVTKSSDNKITKTDENPRNVEGTIILLKKEMKQYYKVL